MSSGVPVRTDLMFFREIQSARRIGQSERVKTALQPDLAVLPVLVGLHGKGASRITFHHDRDVRPWLPIAVQSLADRTGVLCRCGTRE